MICSSIGVARSSLLVPAMAAGVLLCCGRESVAQANPLQNRFSTHDWTQPTGGGGGEPLPGVNDFREFWADVKAPGDGAVYSLGTIEVRTTQNASFSGSQAFPASTLPTFTVTAANAPARQVVMLQQAGVAGANLGFQRFYYGTNQTSGALRATHGRGVAVWPAANPGDMRIAICGESQDEALPLSNVATWPGVGGAGSAGFVAMFDGNGTLLWSHHFFGTATDQHCAITDVSVRVAFVGGVPAFDFVTFSGVSTYGMPAANATLTSVQPFTAPGGGCANSAGGATNNGAGQWDGITGRLVHAHAGGGAATVQFLSSVGGSQQDGLFGVVDIDDERFAVVGSTGNVGVVPAGANFPVTFGNCPAIVAPFSAGVVQVYRAVVGSPLQLEFSQLVGSLTANTNTVARDVLMQRQWGQAGEPGLIVVGATNDGLALGAGSVIFSPSVLPQAAIGGGVDGFVLAGPYIAPPTGLAIWNQATFRGGEGNESLTGVQSWNEFYDHFAVTGTTDGLDIDVASYYRTPVSAPSGQVFALLTGGATPPAIGGAQVGGTGFDRPTAVAVSVAPPNPVMMNATTLGGFPEYGLDNPAGGGITEDQDGRVNVVGTTASNNFPVQAGRVKTGITHDAVRVALDMVPAGIGRTDGTGAPLPPSGPPGGYPFPGVFGGTTPQCALTPFGHQIGLVDPQTAPAAPRMLIDWEGPAPATGVNGAVVVARPPNSSIVLGAALQFNFPGTNPAAPGPVPLLPDGILLWTTDPSALVFTLSPTGLEALRFPLNTLPAGPLTVTAQLICLLSTPVAGGAIGPACPGSGQSSFAASPAMWISW